MQTYRVKLMPHGIWDGKEDKKMEATSPRAAAELAVGSELVERGTIGNLQAQVTTFARNGHNVKAVKVFFYAPAG